MSMRKLEVTEFLTLNGMMDNRAWTALPWNGEIAAFKGNQLKLLLYSVMLSRGKRLFDGKVPGLKLADPKTFSSGVVALTHTLDISQGAAPSTFRPPCCWVARLPLAWIVPPDVIECLRAVRKPALHVRLGD
ncbi:hypothetical protein DESA109040_11550 [Deinococcus saxicola]|uniref:hypothetical protein n=1 Tax=Deinococcus saxicola TaxID=249406 RepID=UPI0039EFB082